MPDAHQPVSDADLHNPNKPGPSSAPPAGPMPLDAATRAAMDSDTPTPRQGESTAA